ncbi:MAG: TIR domain-containing protein [Gammaproteobacteria bacterium]|nr:TIR domain-containing protein [Gammaproteobacteria bacterium]
MKSPASPKNILMLSANPFGAAPLRIDKEARDIRAGLEKYRDHFNFERGEAVRAADMQRALLKYSPQVVHFSGHGQGAGILLEDEQGEAKAVSGEALADLFRLFSRDIECVFLNACYSEQQARAIVLHIPYVIGMSDEISDAAAQIFAVAFYDALGAGKPVPFAYMLACSAIRMEGLNEQHVPVLLRQPGIARIFISYRHEEPDNSLARRCAEALKQAGHIVFIDTGIRWGMNWAQSICQALQDSDYLLLLLSPQSAGSEMVREEVEIARELLQQSGKPMILPVRVQYPFEQKLPYPLADYLDSIQQTVWNGETDTAPLLAQLLELLQQQGGGKADKPAPGSRRIVDETTPQPQCDPRDLVTPGGALETDSRFYIERQADHEALEEIDRPRALITLRGPRQTGKTSLIMRLYMQARQLEMPLRSVFIDFQVLSVATLASQNALWQHIATRIADQLPLDDWDVEDWPQKGNYDRKFSRFLSRFVFRDDPRPLLLCLDEVDRVFNSPLKKEFFSSMRAFFNRGALEAEWKNVRWVLGTSSEPRFFIEDLSQSPFNIGRRIDLDVFTHAEVKRFAERHGLVHQVDIEEIIRLTGGRPYLTHVLLCRLARQSESRLLNAEHAANSLFRDHLHRYLVQFQREPNLAKAMREVLAGKSCRDIALAERLEAAGLVRMNERHRYVPLCELYAEFFGRHL